MNAFKKFIDLALGVTLSAALLAGCAGDENTALQVTPAPTPSPVAAELPTPSLDETLPAPAYTQPGTEEQTTAGETWLDEDGSYSAMEDVALYLHTYGQLPDNFITKNEARELGWSGGGLEEYAPGMCIGGDRFGNREGLLPEGNYRECDIDTLGRDSRGAKRIVWDEAGNIYYTDDHYESFEQIYEGE